MGIFLGAELKTLMVVLQLYHLILLALLLQLLGQQIPVFQVYHSFQVAAILPATPPSRFLVPVAVAVLVQVYHSFQVSTILPATLASRFLVPVTVAVLSAVMA